MATVVTKSDLSSGNGSPGLVILAVKYLLWLFAWLIVAFYAMVWIIMPVKNGEKFYDKIYTKFDKNKQWGGPGAYILLFTGPIVVLAIVACLSLELEKAYPSRRNAGKQRNGWMRRAYDSLWTQPLAVRGPMGMMNAVEIVGFGMVIFVTLWHFWKYTIDWFKVIDAGMSGNDDPRYTVKMQKFEYISVMLGWVALVPMALLFLPVARGSPILKLIDVPFEHAVKYHIWLGHMTLILVLAHGVSYGIFYGVMDEAHLFVKWQKTGIANLPGVIALIAGLFMWPTSLAYVRRRYFNVFFSVHQLYIVFFAFAAWHLGILLTGFFLGGVLLFFIDRFLRFLQSRTAIQGVTARVLPTGIVELRLPVSPGLSFTPLSFMFLNIRGLSNLEWHPFSTASTPLDNSKYMSILIKPLGDWTENLRKSIEENNNFHPEHQASTGARCPFSLQLFAEGPYGHESNYFLQYKHLLLVAGGIGVTPFMAIISDILYRQQTEQVGLPTIVDLIWCVKRRSELNAFKDLFCDPARIFSNYGSRDSEFRVNVKIFLTAERSGAEPAELTDMGIEMQAKTVHTNEFGRVSGSNGHGGLIQSESWPGVDQGGSGSNLLLFAGVTSAVALGLTLFLALFRVYVYLPHTDTVNYERELAGYIDVSLFLVALVVAIVVFGGAVLYGAALGTKYLARSTAGRNVAVADHGRELHIVQGDAGSADIEETGRVESLLERSTVAVGTRPNFTEIMDEIRLLHDNFGGAEVGVLVCGPENMAATVAEQCRSQNFNQLWSNSSTQFHYHSVSFDL